MTATAATRDRVQRYLTDLLGRVEVDDDGFTFSYESTRIFVKVSEFMEQSTTVMVYAITNIDVPVTPDLYKWVAQNTDSYKFGHIGLFEQDGTAMLSFSHTLLGDYLDPEELKAAVIAVSLTADDVDDEVQKRFGGKRMIDL